MTQNIPHARNDLIAIGGALLAKRMTQLQTAIFLGVEREGKFTGPSDNNTIDYLLGEVNVLTGAIKSAIGAGAGSSGQAGEALISATVRYYTSTDTAADRMNELFTSLVRVCSTYKLDVPSYITCHALLKRALDGLAAADKRDQMTVYMAKRRTLFRVICYLKIIHTQQDSVHAVLNEADRRAITNVTSAKGAITPGKLAKHFDNNGSLAHVLTIDEEPSAPLPAPPPIQAIPLPDPSLDGFLSLLPGDDEEA